MKTILLFLTLVFIFSNCNDKLDWVPDNEEGNQDPPVVVSITPAIGLKSVDTEVVIAGKNFSKSSIGNIVTFNGIAATVTHRTDTTLTVIAPRLAETGPVTLQSDGKVADDQPVFTYFDQWCDGYIDVVVSNFKITKMYQITNSGKTYYRFEYVADISNAGTLTIDPATKKINVQAVIVKGTENAGAGGDTYEKMLLSGATAHYENTANSGQLPNPLDVDSAKINLEIRTSFECETGNNEQSVLIKL